MDYKSCILTPAYGRKYETLFEAKLDFKHGRDFVFHQAGSPNSGHYCSIRDLKDYTEIKVRFGEQNCKFGFIRMHDSQ